MQTPADSVGTWNDNAEIQILEKYKKNTKTNTRQIQRLDAIRSTPSIVIYLRAQGSRCQGGELEKGPMSGTY